MHENRPKRTPQNCLWYEHCRCVEICDDYSPMTKEDISDDELMERKYQFRREFFEYAEEHELYDN